MNKICTLLTVTTLCVASSVGAQTVSDNFDDNSRDTELWMDVFVEGGSGQLLEQNERIEFTTPGGFGETDVSQALTRYPTYDQAWQVQMVVSMSPDNFSSLGEVGAVSIDIGSGDHWLGMGYGAGVLSAGPAATALVAGWSVGVGEANNITPLVPAPAEGAIGIRIAYDPQRRLIRTYYDLDTDMTDGDWTLYASFTIDGSTFGDAVVLDWGMTTFDNFYMAIDGYSSGPAIAAGSAWADDFEYTPGRTIPSPTFADDFNDGTRNSTIWSAPFPDADEALTETNGRLEFTTPTGVATWVVQSVNSSPGYDEAWQIQTLVWLDQSQFGTGQLGYMGIGIDGSSPGDKNIDVGMAGGNAPDIDLGTHREGVFTGGHDPILTEDNGYLSFVKDGDLIEAIGVRATYDPKTRIIRTYYDLDSDNSDGEWTLFESYTIDNSTVAGAKTLNWGMTQVDTFYLEVYGGAEGNIAVASGTAWMDDFAFNRGSTVQSELGLSFFDNFNDDSRDPQWGTPFVDLGSPELSEESHRLEFQVNSASGEQEIRQTISQSFWPQYNQAFEVKMETHALPADPMSTVGQVAVVELSLENNSGVGDVTFSSGAANLAGSKEQVYAVSNSEVNPPNDPADVFATGAPPELVGLRITWAPGTHTLSCYVDTDGDPSVETWVLLADYTLDGVDRGAAYTTDWSMVPTDQFRIALNGYADSTVIAPGEAYFDNFSILSEPLAPTLTGYELWASAIPDAGLRATTTDASGNGIPNLLQYMYGLAPMATDTDVKLKIQMNAGTPEVIHGFNSTATDYAIDYLEKLSLTDGWSSGFVPGVIDTFEANGKTFRRITLPAPVGNEFLQVEIIPQF